MNGNGGRENRRQFMHLVLLVCVVGALVVIGVAWRISELQRARCKSDAAMWEWTSSQLAAYDDPEIAAFGVAMQAQIAELLQCPAGG